MDANPHREAALNRGATVMVRDRFLDGDGAAGGFQRAGELYQESVAGGFDFAPGVARENGTEDAPVLLKQVEGEGFICVGQGGVTDHVSKHDRGQFSLFGAFGTHRRQRIG